MRTSTLRLLHVPAHMPQQAAAPARPLRFCMVTTFYPPSNFGGDGITVHRLANTLAEQGHHVEVAHCVDAFDMLRPEGVAPAARTTTIRRLSTTRCAAGQDAGPRSSRSRRQHPG